MTTPPMPVVDLAATWTLLWQEHSRTRVRLRLQASGERTIEVTLSRSLGTALRDAYPVSAHDVAIEITPAGIPEGALQRLLGDVVGAVEEGDPRCRRLVYAVPPSDLTTIATAERAGFRFVVEVEVEDQELALLVAEPDWVTRVDMDLDRVPGS